MPSSQDHEAALFALAVKQPLGEREAFLRTVCHSDNALRQRLEDLLAAHEQPDTDLATQAENCRPTIKLDLAEAPDEAVGQTRRQTRLLRGRGS